MVFLRKLCFALAVLAGADAFSGMAPLSRVSRGSSWTTTPRGGAAAPTMAAAPLAMVVEVVIEEDRVDAFKAALKIDVEGSREEEGCLRFDLLQDNDDPNKFV